LRDFSPGAVIVNANLDVVQFRGRTANNGAGTFSVRFTITSLKFLMAPAEPPITTIFRISTPGMQCDNPLPRPARAWERMLFSIAFSLVVPRSDYSSLARAG
jgi:hypothetical protein